MKERRRTMSETKHYIQQQNKNKGRKEIMKKTNAILASLLASGLLLTGCSSSTTSTSSTAGATDDTAATAETESSWYTGPGYDALYAELGAAEVDLSNADGELKEILDQGYITMATSPDFPPNEFVAEDGTTVLGSDILLGQYIANSLGVELKIETLDFSGVLTAVDTGKVNLGLSGFGYKKDRAEQFELSIGYQADGKTSHHTLLVNAEDADKYTTLEDFNSADLVIDAQANSLQEMYVEDELPNAECQLVSTLDQAILDLQTGKVDAVALSYTTAANYADTSDGLFISVYDQGIEFDLTPYAEYEGNVALVKKGETSLIEVINEIIESMAGNGLYEENLYTDMYYAACDAAGINPGDAD